ncbi:MAG TPA: protein kinase [Vicinamibacterales bacterium]|nr:protein kinase [Vicinamibacterales bacterium]
MSLTSGTRIGPYDIIAPLGAGGMGEVYRARDTRLDRDVAIKILPPAFAADAERLARFEREAKTLASLSHPNIAAIYGIEPSTSAGQGPALVMELIDGEDLSARIARGAIPLDDALATAHQIADALEAAHERGIIHRDLKPANIKVRADGTVKVLDFGLAKALDPNVGSNADLMNSPTITSPATQLGTILGTAAYMAPEQAKGRPLDRRADVWAFGCVLFEMLSGRRAFPGEDVTDTLAAVMRAEPEWSALPARTPPSIQRLLRRSLLKERSKRLDSMAAARLDIDEALDTPDGSSAAQAHITAPVWRRAMPWTVAALGLIVAAAAGVAVWRPSPGLPIRMSIALPDGHVVTAGPIISRDGRRVVFASGSGAGEPRLYLRTLDAFELRALPGTEGAERPFFSPDGTWIGFFARTRLFLLDLDGGAPLPIADAPTPGGGTWSEDGTIVFAPTWNGGLYQVRATGGEVEPLIAPDAAKKEYAYTWPVFLPGGKELLFSVWGARFEIARLTFPGLDRDVVVADAWTRAVYAATGHLLLANNQGDIQAFAYPPSGSGTPVSVLGNIHWSGAEGDGLVKFEVSTNGTLVFAPGDIMQRTLVIVDEAGRATPVPAEPQMYLGAKISPDGRRAAAGMSAEIWIVDLERGTRAPVAAEERSGAKSGPVWSRDGSRLVLASNHEGNWEIYAVNASQHTAMEPVLRKEGDQFPTSFAPDGTLLFDETRSETGRDMWLLSPGGTSKRWLGTRANEGYGTFSPDGRLIAYESDLSGRMQIYVQAREGGTGPVQVSGGGGVDAAWSPAGDRIFFREGSAMMAADVRLSPALSVSAPRRLFDGGWELPSGAHFSVMPDGKRFLMVRFAKASIPTRIDVVFNWFEELRKRAPR